jgi:pimeloyl-ACP methyl ester carboxylesterase
MFGFNISQLSKDRNQRNFKMKRVDLREKIISNMGTQVEEKVVKAGKIKTNCLVAGNGEAILLLHGNNSAGAVTWYPVIKSLSAYSQVIAPDVVGYGESDKPITIYDRSFFSSWLKDFLDALDIETLSVVGNSQGGSIALQFVLDYPERVKKLVLADSASLGKEIPFGAIFGFVWSHTFPSSISGKWLNRYLVHDINKIDETWAKYLCTAQRTLKGKLAFWLGFGRATAPIPMEQLGKISHKTLIVWGEEEKLFPLSHAENAKRIMPNAQLHIIRNAGHITFFDQPEIFNDVIKRFLT